jgi:Tripartite tricarboxylate transporter family receptor
MTGWERVCGRRGALRHHRLDPFHSGLSPTKKSTSGLRVAEAGHRGGSWTPRRRSALPDLPSTRECGVTNLDLESWWSVHVPVGTPAVIIQKLAAWIDQFAASDETKKFLSDTTSAEPLLGGAKAVDELMAKDRVKWADYVRIAKIEPQ